MCQGVEIVVGGGVCVCVGVLRLWEEVGVCVCRGVEIVAGGDMCVCVGVMRLWREEICVCVSG